MIGFKRDSRGQSLVEFALIVPIFILMLVGILDFGRAIYAYNTVNNSAREAGRLAIVDQTVSDIRAKAAEHATSLGILPATIYVDFRNAATPELADSCDGLVGSPAVVGCLAVVQVPYPYTAVTPILSQIIGPISLNGETRFRIETDCMEPTAASCPIGD